MGMHTEDVDTRGRWKSGSSGAGKAGSVVEKHYISPNQPFIDANVAAQLCNGSPIGYEIHDDTMEFVNDGWLLQKVVPRMHDFFRPEQSPALVLAPSTSLGRAGSSLRPSNGSPAAGAYPIGVREDPTGNLACEFESDCQGALSCVPR